MLSLHTTKLAGITLTSTSSTKSYSKTSLLVSPPTVLQTGLFSKIIKAKVVAKTKQGYINMEVQLHILVRSQTTSYLFLIDVLKINSGKDQNSRQTSFIGKLKNMQSNSSS